mmetsp:Transcript_40169/g.40971  ORF Transcript_40169/g.40971 Transcript_40169/m.40971 type:complete len:191 (-) Transcript_40169:40-612(-)
MISGEVKSPQKKPTKIKWDEEVISEHNKLRGTRQKIDEPPTPFRYHCDSDQEHDQDHEHEKMEMDIGNTSDESNNYQNYGNINDKNNVSANNPARLTSSELNAQVGHEVKDNWEAINAKLNFHETQQNEEEEPRKSRGMSFDKDTKDNTSRRSSNSNVDLFKEKRAAHYNEFKVLKAMNKKIKDEEREEE